MCFVVVCFPPFLPDRKEHCKVWDLLVFLFGSFLVVSFFFYLGFSIAYGTVESGT